MQLFYNANATIGLFSLDSEESRHAIRVMRLHSGDTLYVADGHGSIFTCHIMEANDRACVVEALSCMQTNESAQSKLTLAVAPTKNPSRMEWLVEKAVEIGVHEIALIQCDHSERAFLKTDRLQKIAISAMKQSNHALLPTISMHTSFQEWISCIPVTTTCRLIAHCETGRPRIPITTLLDHNADTVILIGPEGDFSTNEIDTAISFGFKAVSLGPSRLRTETAALYATVAFNLHNN